MKIKNIEKFPITIHSDQVGYREEDRKSYVWAPGISSVIIIINTDENISGLGEATSLTWYFNETREGI